MSAYIGLTLGTIVARRRDGQRGRVHAVVGTTPLVEVAWHNGSRSQEQCDALRVVAETECALCDGEGTRNAAKCPRCDGFGRHEAN